MRLGELGLAESAIGEIIAELVINGIVPAVRQLRTAAPRRAGLTASHQRFWSGRKPAITVQFRRESREEPSSTIWV
jgi:hypothetical protein